MRTAWLDLVLDEAPASIRDSGAAARLLAREAAARPERSLPGPDSPAGGWLARLRWLAAAVPDLGLPTIEPADLVAVLPDVCHGLRSLDEVAAADWLPRLRGLVGPAAAAQVESLAPAQLELPSGRKHRLAYDSGSPVLAVRIQDLFGVRDTPRIADGRVPVLLHLLGPDHRPRQITSDLAGFWRTGYPALAKELRRRYPKHAWPDDPFTASRRG